MLNKYAICILGMTALLGSPFAESSETCEVALRIMALENSSGRLLTFSRLLEGQLDVESRNFVISSAKNDLIVGRDLVIASSKVLTNKYEEASYDSRPSANVLMAECTDCPDFTGSFLRAAVNIEENLRETE